MLWYLDYEITKWFLFFSLFGTFIATLAIAFLPIKWYNKVVIIAMLLIQSYMSFLVSDNMLGKPKPNNYEIDGSIEGYTIYSVNGAKKIAILVKINYSERPVTVSVNWDEETEKKLQSSMENKQKYNIPTGIRTNDINKPNKHHETPKLEFYDLIDKILPNKGE